MSSIYELHVELQGIQPPIWRRVQVPAKITLERLHRIIQAAMGWQDQHLFDFEVQGDRYGEPMDELEEIVKDAATYRLKWALCKEGDSLTYTYDYGDSWLHTVRLERILEPEEGAKYPVCTDGARACPPEDCGGSIGYERLLGILSDPGHPEHRQMLRYVGRSFNPEMFNVKKANRRLARYQVVVKGKKRNDPREFRSAVMAALESATGSMTAEEIQNWLKEKGVDLGPKWKNRIRSALSQDNPLVTRVGRGRYDLLTRRANGAVFRYRLSEAEIAQGRVLGLGDLEHLLTLHPKSRWKDVELFDDSGRPLELTFESIKALLENPDGVLGLGGRFYQVVSGLAGFFSRHGAQAGDALVIRVDDLEESCFTLRLEKAPYPDSEAVDGLDKAVAKAASECIHRVQSTILPKELLHRVIGLVDLRNTAGAHLPMFCLADDPDISFDGTWYMASSKMDGFPVFGGLTGLKLRTGSMDFESLIWSFMADMLPGPTDDLVFKRFVEKIVSDVPEEERERLVESWETESEALQQLLDARLELLQW